MPEHSEILASLYMQITVQKFPNQQLNYPPAIQCNSRPNEYTLHQQQKGIGKSCFDLYNLFIFKDFQSFTKLPEQMFRINQVSTVPLFCSAGENQVQLYQQSRIRYFYSFVDEAAPGFELGKKDLQSPALPLGHAAKTIHNRIKNYRWITKLQFIVLASPFSSLNKKKIIKETLFPLLIVFYLPP